MRWPRRSDARQETGPRPPGHRPRSGHGDHGAVTVEAAIAIGTLVLVATAALGAVATVLASVRCLDAARELARAAARGDTDGGRAVAARIAPTGSRMEVTLDGDTLVAVVEAEPLGVLPIDVTGSATGMVEPGVARSSATPIPDSPPDTEAPANPEAPGDPDTPSGPVGPTDGDPP